MINETLSGYPGVDNDTRSMELSIIDFETSACSNEDWPNCYYSEAIYDNKWNSQINAILNMGRTVFVIIILGLGALLFSRDANILVLYPLEKMIQMVI